MLNMSNFLKIREVVPITTAIVLTWHLKARLPQ